MRPTGHIVQSLLAAMQLRPNHHPSHSTWVGMFASRLTMPMQTRNDHHCHRAKQRVQPLRLRGQDRALVVRTAAYSSFSSPSMSSGCTNLPELAFSAI